ncbi:MAG: ABC transporter substrate-binding protein [Candidatus Eisenbacteria bacterium]|nr:ABC transporter substrate-binding protein [Candidatus Eisenbacteria bacterium]
MTRAPQHIVSLVPSLTEAISDLGAGGRLVGVTSYCPPLASRSSSDGQGARAASSPEIVGGPRTPSLEKIRALAPDLVVACAEENPAAILADIAPHARVLAFSCHTLDDAEAMLLDLGRALACEERAILHRDRFRAVRDEIRRVGESDLRPGENDGRTAPRHARAKSPARRIFYPVWRAPWIAVGRGCFPAAMLTEAGGESIFADRGVPYPKVDLEAVRAGAPEIFFLPDEPWPFGEGDIDCLAPLFGDRPARFVPVPGRWAAWYGTRMDEGLRGLAAILRAPAG